MLPNCTQIVKLRHPRPASHDFRYSDGDSPRHTWASVQALDVGQLVVTARISLGSSNGNIWHHRLCLKLCSRRDSVNISNKTAASSVCVMELSRSVMQITGARRANISNSAPSPAVPTISIAVPACNEQATLAEVVEWTIAELKQLTSTFEVIVVDDGSTDRTGQIADGPKRLPCARVT